MREIKFRMWDTEEKQFMNHSRVIESRVLDLEKNGQERFIFQQYTGLKDRKRQEMYEGDILLHTAESGILSVQAYGMERKYGKGEKFIVAFLECGLVLRHIDSFGKRGYEIPNCIFKGWPIVESYQFWNLHNGFEVIGNIYENPELLEVSP